MSQAILPNPLPYFERVPDPRRETKNKLHRLTDIIMITLCGLLSGVED
ncbi:MAG: transposase family protein [Pseudomonadota bacterium]|nr:transposase family protein [Pseudomonadota bacterium]